ncbi:ribonuclease H-like domain-containing protein [Amanita rubescens]|nr:ribonuclease H-like domain-containing protein [Amanita rubescens]
MLTSSTSRRRPFSPLTETVIEHRGTQRDEVGLVRAICVKEHLSAQHKELFKRIQLRDEDGHIPSKRPKQLLMDMKVRWSSTYVMLERAESLKDEVDYFVRRLGLQEKDSNKAQKLLTMQLSLTEWDRVRRLLSLLGHAEKAQQAFSSDQGPTLHLALPALEALHKAWSTRFSRTQYADFQDGLNAGIDKIIDYYDRSADSDAYIMAMLLDPTLKIEHVRKYWGEELAKNALEHTEEMYKQRYLLLYRNSPAPRLAKGRIMPHTRSKKVQRLMRELSSDDDSGSGVDGLTGGATPTTSASNFTQAAKPWLDDFNAYLNSRDYLMEDQTVVQWWGLNGPRYPVWASLAHDFLSRASLLIGWNYNQ